MIKINELDLTEYFEVGETIYGFCNGMFGRDDYNNKIVIDVKKDYVIFRYEDETSLTDSEGYVEINEYNMLSSREFLLYYETTKLTEVRVDLLEQIKDWKTPEEY